MWMTYMAEILSRSWLSIIEHLQKKSAITQPGALVCKMWSWWEFRESWMSSLVSATFFKVAIVSSNCLRAGWSRPHAGLLQAISDRKSRYFSGHFTDCCALVLSLESKSTSAVKPFFLSETLRVLNLPWVMAQFLSVTAYVSVLHEERWGFWVINEDPIFVLAAFKQSVWWLFWLSESEEIFSES